MCLLWLLSSVSKSCLTPVAGEPALESQSMRTDQGTVTREKGLISTLLLSSFILYNVL